MGLFSALNTAVNGLQSQSFALQNISGNISNSQTTAYKAIDTNFVDLIPDAPAGQQVAGGVIASSISSNTVQGTIQDTSISTNMAINGDGYFAVKQPTSSTGSDVKFDTSDLYTRRGDFQLDENGYLVNGGGYYLEGIPIDAKTGNLSGSALEPLQFDNTTLQATPTTTITYGANLPSYPKTTNSDTTVAKSELLDPTAFTVDPTVAGTGTVVGSDVTAFLNSSLDGGTVNAYDSAGELASIEMRWAKIDSSASGGTNTWELFYQTDSTATGSTVAWQNAGTDFTFDSSGKLTAPTGSVTINNVTVDNTSLGNLTLKLSGLTQYSATDGTVSTTTLKQDGYASGQLQSISVGKNGRISGSFTNGKNIDLAEVPLYSFASPNNLQNLDGGAFKVTGDSGPALSGATGKLVGASLEESNADIASQFTKLIVTQQAYAANTKVITTANQMSQDLLNVLR